MGVSGVGKTTVGEGLARRLGARFLDADDLHSPESIAKMRAGVALVDDDRLPWLDRVGGVLAGEARVVVACSALKRGYRDRLRAAAPATMFVHLEAAPDRVARQVEERAGHFMPPGLLRSQIATLEPLDGDESGVRVVVDAEPEVLVGRIEKALSGSGG